MKKLLYIFLGLSLMFGCSDDSNPAVENPSENEEEEENISALLQESCYDCHSNNTEYPWYNKVQPVAWFLEDHINEGKEELNFNEWDAYSNRRKNSKLKSIISQVKDDEMPLASYTLIHKDAKLSNSEKTLIIDYMKNLKETLK